MENLIESAGSFAVQRVAQFRLKPGADLLGGITQALAEERVRAGVFISGLGALQKAVFRNLKVFPASYPVTPADRLYLEVTAPMELVSLTGWIAPAVDGTVEIHAHFAASLVQDDTVVTMGGHLTEGTLCGIKVVGAVLVLDEGRLHADLDPASRSRDVFFTPPGEPRR